MNLETAEIDASISQKILCTFKCFIGQKLKLKRAWARRGKQKISLPYTARTLLHSFAISPYSSRLLLYFLHCIIYHFWNPKILFLFLSMRHYLFRSGILFPPYISRTRIIIPRFRLIFLISSLLLSPHISYSNVQSIYLLQNIFRNSYCLLAHYSLIKTTIVLGSMTFSSYPYPLLLLPLFHSLCLQINIFFQARH